MKEEKSLILYFQVHQPKRLRTLRFFDIGSHNGYFDDALNRTIIQRVSRNGYLRTNALLLKLIRQNARIKIAFSISGAAIDQFDEYAPEVLDSFRGLAETGSVEFLTETYYHSLACMMPGNEFELQVEKHRNAMRDHFGQVSDVFRNTELIYSDDIGRRIKDLGLKGVIIDGLDGLATHGPNYVYEHAGLDNLKLLLRNYRLSDDISFRFSQFREKLSAARYTQWLDAIPADENAITLAMDYETFGEHQIAETGIFRFLEDLLSGLAADPRFRFVSPSEALKAPAVDALAIPGCISWADGERDVSPWLGNDMQRDAFDTLVRLESDVKKLHDKRILTTWRALQTSDHFYYMATRNGNDGAVHAYFSPYPSPYEAFINYMNVLTDFDSQIKINKASIRAGKKTAHRENPELMESEAM